MIKIFLDKIKFYVLNGDNPNITSRLCITIQNILTYFKEKPVSPQQSSIQIIQIDTTHLEPLSPSRRECISTYPLIAALIQTIDNPRILELGPGKEPMLLAFTKIGLPTEHIQYFGIDKDYRKNDSIIVADLNQPEALAKAQRFEPNIIFSQSVLEHIRKDKRLIQQLRTHFPNAIHIHLVPAAYSMFNYWLHGYRKYTRAELKSLFGNQMTTQIIPLGAHVTRLQFAEHIRKTRDRYSIIGNLIKIRRVTYPNQTAVTTPTGECPSFYLVISQPEGKETTFPVFS